MLPYLTDNDILYHNDKTDQVNTHSTDYKQLIFGTLFSSGHRRVRRDVDRGRIRFSPALPQIRPGVARDRDVEFPP